MKKTLILVLVFLSITNAIALALQEAWPGLMHVHTQGWSDGTMTMEEVAAEAQRLKNRFIEFSDHGDSMKKNDFPYYFNQGSALNSDGRFVTLIGREITVGNKRDTKGKLAGNNCHINTMSSAATPFIDGTIYSNNQLINVLDALANENAIYVWNHPRTCPQWNANVSRFQGIEVFNEYILAGDLKLYLNAVANGWHGFVIGGSDFHGLNFRNNSVIKKAQLQLKIRTFVFSNSVSRQDIFLGIRNRSTVAVEKINAIAAWPIPSAKPISLSGGPVTITMEVEYDTLIPPATLCAVYHNGAFKIKARMKKIGRRYRFTYNADKPGSYVFVIPGFMVTSPYWFE